MIARKISVPTVAVIGGGSWATALVKILSENDLKVKWWMRNKEAVSHIKNYGHNPHYLSDVHINTRKVKVDSSIIKTMEGVETVILAVPAAFVKEALEPLNKEHFKGVQVVSAVKGMIPGENLLISEFIEKKYFVHETDLLAIGGPCHSEEVALEKQSFLTIACKDYTNGLAFSQFLNCRFVKTHCLTDIYGMEYASILKNIYSIACGISHGLNFGDNFQAVLVSNAMQEMKRFLDAKCPQSNRDLNDSAYLGDLLVTCYSQFSRNRTFGGMIGRGYSVKSAQLEMRMVAEGFYAVKCVHEVNKKLEIDMPICKAVYNILYEKISPSVEIQILKSVLR
ncbi:MAG: NAD(P)H-dependent glycerol-3-phosphate dehydrogenase [Cytophagales bacterium]